MPRIYPVSATFTVTAAQGDVDFFSFVPGDDKPIILRGFRPSQLSEIGDAQEENLRITVRRMTATVTIGTGGTALTAIPPARNSAEPVWGFSGRFNDGTVATTTGANVIYDEIAWNVRNSPYEVYPFEEDACLMARQTEAIIIRGESVVADDITFCMTAWIQEA